jgi:hypothetical protein
MCDKEEIMVATQFGLTHDEREYLVGLLQSVLKETRVEEHRTRAPLYRQHVLEKEDIIVAILSKLKAPV